MVMWLKHVKAMHVRPVCIDMQVSGFGTATEVVGRMEEYARGDIYTSRDELGTRWEQVA